MAELTLKLKGRDLKTIPITNAEMIIGRDPGCEVFLDNQGISRNHAKIVFADWKYTLYDDESSNGTFVNGEQIDGEVVLDDNDEIQVGKFELVFSSMGGPEDPKPRFKSEFEGQSIEDAKELPSTVQLSPAEMKKMMDAKRAEVETAAAGGQSTGGPMTSGASEGSDQNRKLMIALGVAAFIILVLLIIVMAK